MEWNDDKRNTKERERKKEGKHGKKKKFSMNRKT